MTAPTHIAASARARIEANLAQIRDSVRAIAEDRPEDAEYDKTRQAAVIVRRLHVGLGRAVRMAAADGREKTWGPTIDFVDAVFLERGMYAARSVARVITREGQDIGTGFMISPSVFLTNNHVIPTEAAARGLLVEFDYERDLSGAMKAVTRYALAPASVFVTNHADDLDYTAVALGERESGAGALPDFGYLPLSGTRDKHQLGDHVNIIQHPDGRPKEAVLRENQLVGRAKTALHYVADTEPGSSGSPVFNVLWQVVALHHWGGPYRELVDEEGRPLAKTVNEGIRISAIVGDLNTRKNSLPAAKRELVNEALTIGLEPEAVRRPPAGERAAPSSLEGRSVTIAPDGTATWIVPLRVSVQLGGLEAAAAQPTAAPSLTPGPAGEPQPRVDGAGSAEAALQLDDDYSDRSGYDAGFLGEDPISLPRLATEAMQADASVNREAVPGRSEHELTYEHFSVVMNGRRKLAFFTATNINGETAKNYDRKTGRISDPHEEPEDEDDGAEASERWFPERRIPADEQTPPKFYEGQTAFDAHGRPIEDRRTADHRDRIFQQGHLTRRQDPVWGDDPDLLYRSNADTFHVTNRAPQIGYFNMGIGKRNAESGHPGGQLHWRAIEDYVLNNAIADRKLVTVFTGPVLDDEHDIPWDRGMADMKGFKAPREYWKLILRREQGELRATVLIADQTPLIDYVPERSMSDAELKRVAFTMVQTYHDSVAELERRTGLDFGDTVRAADTHGGGERRVVRALNDVIASAGATGSARTSKAVTRRGRRRGR